MVRTVYVAHVQRWNPQRRSLAEADRARRSSRQRLVDRGADRAAGVAASGQEGAQASDRRRRGRANRADRHACARAPWPAPARRRCRPVRGRTRSPSARADAGVSSAAIAVRPSPLRSCSVADEGLREREVVEEPDPREPLDLDVDRLVVDAAIAKGALELALRQSATGERPQARRAQHPVPRARSGPASSSDVRSRREPTTCCSNRASGS